MFRIFYFVGRLLSFPFFSISLSLSLLPTNIVLKMKRVVAALVFAMLTWCPCSYIIQQGSTRRQYLLGGRWAAYAPGVRVLHRPFATTTTTTTSLQPSIADNLYSFSAGSIFSPLPFSSKQT